MQETEILDTLFRKGNLPWPSKKKATRKGFNYKVESLKPQIMAYIRERTMYDEPLDEVDNDRILAPISKEARDMFFQALDQGASIQQASYVADIPLPTITEVWFKNSPKDKAEAERRARLSTINIQFSLYRKAQGYDLDVRKHTISNDGFEKVSTFKRHYAPDLSAIKFWLTNRDPNLWREAGASGLDSKGEILEALDKLAEISEDELNAEDSRE